MGLSGDLPGLDNVTMRASNDSLGTVPELIKWLMVLQRCGVRMFENCFNVHWGIRSGLGPYVLGAVLWF